MTEVGRFHFLLSLVIMSSSFFLLEVYSVRSTFSVFFSTFFPQLFQLGLVSGALSRDHG